GRVTVPAKVDLAYFSFTEITDPAEHGSYNEWHLFDHMPENLALPGIVWAQRWVASPNLPALAVDDALRPVHYVTVYLMTEPAERGGRALARRRARARPVDRARRRGGVDVPGHVERGHDAPEQSADAVGAAVLAGRRSRTCGRRHRREDERDAVPRHHMAHLVPPNGRADRPARAVRLVRAGACSWVTRSCTSAKATSPRSRTTAPRCSTRSTASCAT